MEKENVGATYGIQENGGIEISEPTGDPKGLKAIVYSQLIYANLVDNNIGSESRLTAKGLWQ